MGKHTYSTDYYVCHICEAKVECRSYDPIYGIDSLKGWVEISVKLMGPGVSGV